MSNSSSETNSAESVTCESSEIGNGSSGSCESSESNLKLSDCNIQERCSPKRKPKPRKKQSCGSSKGKCAKPGKITRNPFFNFLRDFRQKNCGKSMTKIAQMAGCVWRKMPDCEKEKYRKMACSAPKTRRHRKSKTRKPRKKRCGHSRT